MGVSRWTFVLGCVWLGHRVITNHVCAQAVARFYPVPPKTGSCTLIIKDWNLRSLVTSDICEGGGVTLGNYCLNLSTFHNTFIHILGSHARFGGIPIP